MSYRKKIAVMLPLLLIAATTIYVNKFFTSIGSFTYHFSVAFLIILIILFFSNRDIFNSWKKFSIVFMIISIVIISLAPEISDGFIEYSKKYLSQKLSVLFLIISLGIIIWKSIQLKKKSLK
ncbi:MAG: hypothetical protein ACD_7C00074G0001 [uncultured bacterium]|nr:MAG: hypothetical protein ACD_7C00074G0001 [uncultured bacterium]HBR79012.1 hypothetical protein [Candidatus Moranbacteria bacterium]